MNYNIFEVESKEDLLTIDYNYIVRSLIIYNGVDPDNALLMAYFVSNKKRPDVHSLQKNYLEFSKTCDKSVLYEIPDEYIEQLKRIMDINKMTGFESNTSLL